MQSFYSDRFVLPLTPTHRFPMEKYRRLRERLLAEGVLHPEDLHEPPAATWDELGLVHEETYLRAVADGSLPPDVQRRMGFPWSAAMVERSRRSVGGTIAAARAALDEGVAANLAGGTHHAFRDRGEGYCVFNDVAVAARVILQAGACARVAVVDCDVHQGDGTASIFRNDPAVFTFSLHGEKNYPFRKESSDLDITLPDGARDDEYLAALEVGLREVMTRHDPQLVFYVAGADPYEGDRLGRLRLTMDGLAARDRLVFSACRGRNIPVAVSMGGGYALDVDAIVSIHVGTVREACRWTRSSAGPVTSTSERA